MTPTALLSRRAAAALAFSAGAVLTWERMADAMWGTDVPASARKVVQNHVLALRRSLGPRMIETRPGGYLLAIAPDDIDAVRFDALVRSGRSAWNVGHAAAAIDHFGAALELWRGEPYPDLADWPPARAEIARLSELHDTAVEDRLRALLAQEEHVAAVAEIEASVADAPLRERRWELLMLALYRSGRQGDALRAFQRARDALTGQLGIEPGVALQRLEAAILAQDPALDRPAPLAAPWAELPVTRTGDVSDDALRAADLAFRRGAPDEAAACYRTALTHVAAQGGSLRRECEVLLRLAESEYLAGDPTCRSTGIAAARLADHLGDGGLLVRAALAGSRQIEAAPIRVDQERVALLRRALERATTPSDQAQVLAALAAELNAAPDHAERRELSDAALALARTSGDAWTLHQVLAARFATIEAPDTLHERLANTGEDLALVGQLDARSRWGALSNRAMACLEVGDLAESERSDQEAAEIAKSSDLPAMRWRAELARARQLTWHGDLRSAARQAKRALATGEAAGEAASYLFVGQRYLILWTEGRLAQIGDGLDSTPLERPLDRAFACHAYAHLSRPRPAAQLLAGLAARGFAGVPYDGRWLTVMSLVADAAARIGAIDVADEVLELLWPWHDHIIVTPTTCLGNVAHYVGILCAAAGRARAADDAFAQALETHDRLGAPIWAARTRLEWARSLMSRDGERASALLALSTTSAQAYGARGIVADAAALEARPLAPDTQV